MFALATLLLYNTLTSAAQDATPTAATTGQAAAPTQIYALAHISETDVRVVVLNRDGSIEPLSPEDVVVETYAIANGTLATVVGDQIYIDNEPLLTINRRITAPPALALSADASTVYYSNETGLYAVDVATGEALLLLEHIDFMNPDNPNGVGDGRFYSIANTLPNTDALLVTVGLWEASTVGVYTPSTGDIVTLDEGWGTSGAPLQLFNKALPLPDDRLLLYSRDGRGCTPCGLWVAPSPAELTDVQQVVSGEALRTVAIEDPDMAPPATPLDAVALNASIVRVLVNEFDFAVTPPENRLYVMDANIVTGETSIVWQANIDGQPPILQQLSPDGETILALQEVDFSRPGFKGNAVLIDMATGETSIIPATMPVSVLTFSQ